MKENKDREYPTDLDVVERNGQKPSQSDGRMTGDEEINTVDVNHLREKHGHERRQKDNQTTSKQTVTRSRPSLSVPSSM